jgi:hypothetical protein
MHTSATSLDLIDGIDVSSAVSKIANVGTTVFGFRFACAGITVIAIVVAISAIVAISFFIKLILLNRVVFVNRSGILIWVFAWIPLARIHISCFRRLGLYVYNVAHYFVHYI